jgi:two-component system sensor histidine kinase PhoQ
MLPIIGFTLSNAFEQQLTLANKNELKAYSYSIFTVAEVESSTLLMPEVLLENRFNVSQSGLYAVITPLLKGEKNTTLWQSKSLITLSLPTSLPAPDIGQTKFSEIILSENLHLLYSFSVSFSDKEQDFPVTLHLIKDQQQSLSALNDFRKKLWTWLLALMGVFVFVQIIWLLWTLKPLSLLTSELEEIEKGQKKSLDKQYPLELQQVTQQLNTLLTTEENQRTRYRNALSDLAHSLKNPLAVIQSQTDISTSACEQLERINQIIEHQLKRAQSAGQSSWYLGVQINTVVEKLIVTLSKIYHMRDITFNAEVDESATFKGDEADLMEMLGNILDNACKAAKTKVSVQAYVADQNLIIKISDDGDGIAESEQKLILSRGGRADTYQAGHGIGLAIVNDLVNSYQGKLLISESEVLSGATFTLVFDMPN